MKELSIEERAKQYDEALIVAKQWYNDSDTSKKEKYLLKGMFPKLAESEDERIKKAIKYALEHVFTNNTTVYETTKEQCLAWIEKQCGHTNFLDKIQIGDEVTRNEDGALVNLSQLKRVAKKQGEQKSYVSETMDDKHDFDSGFTKMMEKEQKPADKVDMKFKVEKDKWYVCTSQYCNYIEGRNYKASLDGRIIDDYGTEYDMHDDAYRWFRPWTIQDAKDGDVLVDEDDNIGICKEIESNYWDSHIYLGCDGKLRGFSIGGKHEQTDTLPATKEQREQLENAMAAAGYTFDFEKKELKKIEQKPAENKELTEFDKAVGVSIGTWNPKTPEQIQSVKVVSKKTSQTCKETN